MKLSTARIVFALVVASALYGQQPDPPLSLERMGVLYVGGKRTPMGGGRGTATQTQIAEQAMVHYFIPPSKPTNRRSLWFRDLD